MITQAILDKVLQLTEEAKTNSEDFRSDHEQNLLAIGDSAEEYSLYEIELSEEYYLVMDFVNYKLEDISLVSRVHETHISYNTGEDPES